MHIEQKVNIHNRFDIEVNGKWVGYAENIVLNSMWSRLCNGQTYFANIHFGTGTGALSAARTSLFTHLGTKTGIIQETIKAIPTSKWKKKIVLNPEEYVGAILTEVGISWDTNAGSLLTHALLKDAEGNPITITKTALDVVTIYATVFVSLNPSTVIEMDVWEPSQNIIIAGLLTDTGLSSFPGYAELLESKKSKFALSSKIMSWTADIPNKKRKANVMRFGISEGNGNVKAFACKPLFVMDFPASGIFEGQSYVNVPIGTGDGIKKKWTLPSNNIKINEIVMKIDGVVQPVTKNLKYAHIPVEFFDDSAYASYGMIVSPNGRFITISNFLYELVNGKIISKETLPMATGGSTYYVNSNGDVIGQEYNGINGYFRRNGIVEPFPFPFTNGPFAHSAWISDDGNTIAYMHDSSTIRVVDWVNNVWVTRPLYAMGYRYNIVTFSADKMSFAYRSHSSNRPNVFVTWNGTNWIVTYGPVRNNNIDSNSKGYSTPDATVLINYTDLYVKIDNVWVFKETLPLYEHGNLVKLANGDYMWLYVTNSSPILNIRVYDASLNLITTFSKTYPVDAITILPCFNGDLCGLHHRSGSSTMVGFTGISKTNIEVEFDTAPATSAAITSDYIINGVHKTDQYVIDVSFAIVFGEGV